MVEVTVTGVVTDSPRSTIVVLEGEVEGHDHPVWFAAERRPALDIIEALARGESPVAMVEEWQTLGEVGHADVRFALIVGLTTAAITAAAFGAPMLAIFLFVAAAAVRLVPGNEPRKNGWS